MLKSIKKRLLRDVYDRLNDVETALRIQMDSPEFTPGDAVGFNGQHGRKEIFNQVVEAFDFSAIVETGTFVGDTSGYMATTTGLPVHTCELIPVFSSLAKKRLAKIENVHFTNDDSRAFIQRISQNPDIVDHPCFIYLDAHWGRDLPLKSELDTIARHWRQFVVMIDDFQVPGQRGYGYDRYGLAHKTNAAYIRPVLEAHDLALFFPTLPADEESGARVGSGIVVKGNADAERIAALSSLRRHTF